MPICTVCTAAVPFLYTVYESAYNLRLEQCGNCHTFADPYVEHDFLTLILDLILLKRGVFRHLLYNRGTEPRRFVGGTAVDSDTLRHVAAHKEKMRLLTICRFGGPLICVDAFIRWSHLKPNQPSDVSPWTWETMQSLFRTFIGVLVETMAFHAGVICACYVVLGIADRLALFYSSLTKLFLLFLLTIWRPSSKSITLQTSPLTLQLFDDDKIDREWVVRNVLGGMSAGFGLRVVLDSHPLFTTIIIISGWVAKTAVSHLVSRWVGGDEQMGEAWRANEVLPLASFLKNYDIGSPVLSLGLS